MTFTDELINKYDLELYKEIRYQILGCERSVHWWWFLGNRIEARRDVLARLPGLVEKLNRKKRDYVRVTAVMLNGVRLNIGVKS